jgi:hypothetical protein
MTFYPLVSSPEFRLLVRPFWGTSIKLLGGHSYVPFRTCKRGTAQGSHGRGRMNLNALKDSERERCECPWWGPLGRGRLAPSRGAGHPLSWHVLDAAESLGQGAHEARDSSVLRAIIVPCCRASCLARVLRRPLMCFRCRICIFRTAVRLVHLTRSIGGFGSSSPM